MIAMMSRVWTKCRRICVDGQSEEQSAEDVGEQSEEQGIEHVGEQSEEQSAEHVCEEQRAEPPPSISEPIDHP